MATLRGTDSVYVNNANSATIPLPAGATAGDLCFLFASHQFNPNLPPAYGGWQQIDDQSGTNISGAAFFHVVNAEEVSNGGVLVNFTGTYYGHIAMVTFVGPVHGLRTFVSQRDATSAPPVTISTDGSPVSGDYALYFGSGRFNGPVTSSNGSTLESDSNTNHSFILAGGTLGSSGSVSNAFGYGVTPTGDYQIIVIVASTATSDLRQSLILSEAMSEGFSNVLQPLILSEVLSEGNLPQLRQSLITSDILSEGYPTLRHSLIVAEILHPVPPEGTVSTELFPGSQGSSIALPGLQWPIHKRPLFNTAVYKGASGVSVRRANMQYPIWEFDLSYEFLRDSVNQEFQILMDFFLARQGGFDTFLLKDKDDYLVTNGFLATTDGVTTQFAFVRSFAGTFYDKVGQVDTNNTITLYGTVAENGTIPNLPGPYTITVAHSATFVADGGVTKGGVPMVNVPSAPAAGQYSYAAGVYTFNSADHSQAVVITYRYTLDPLGYTVTLPNLVVFSVAPASGLIITADFQFFFNCRFQDDTADFDKFAVTFWELQKIVLETVPQ